MEKQKEGKNFKIFSYIGVFSSIFSAVVMIVTLIIVERIEDLVDTSKEWIMKLELIEPTNESELDGKVEILKGKFEFYTTAVEAHNKGAVNLTMYQNSVNLLCFVRPLALHNSNQPKYYLQSKPIVNQNGDFEGLISFGNLNEDDLETRYQIIVLAVPQKSIPKCLIHDDLPFYLASSNIVVVRRVEHKVQQER
ncbi:MAG: hypothetical protein PVH61_13295 [Candidatus Aminicenantes bacterium]|jgi:hypothetical protein